VASSSVVIPKRQDLGVKLYPPLLLKTEKNAFYLGESSAVYPYDANQYSPLIEALEQGTRTVWAAVRCSVSGIPTPDLQLSANLIHHSSDSSRTIPAIITILERYHEVDTQVFLLEILTEGLEPGKYFLYLFATDGPTQSRSGTNITFSVK
jgi:hypothetical protein